VRQAMQMAIDRDSIQKDLIKETGQPSVFPLYSAGDEPACASAVCRSSGMGRQGCDLGVHRIYVLKFNSSRHIPASTTH